ncbi:MAG: aminotransferase class IV [Nanoarchaeota archaeon]
MAPTQPSQKRLLTPNYGFLDQLPAWYAPGSMEEIAFGKRFGPNMTQRRYDGEKWKDPEISQGRGLTLDGTSLVFSYGDELFEGWKAFRHKTGEYEDQVVMWRPDKNAQRLNRGARRMNMPEMDEAEMIEMWMRHLHAEKHQIPHDTKGNPLDGAAFYGRPIMIPLDEGFRIEDSVTHLHYVVGGPVGPYFDAKSKGATMVITLDHPRVVKKGIGDIKAGPNYAWAKKVQAWAKRTFGAAEVLYLDHSDPDPWKCNITEYGAANHAHIKDGKFFFSPEGNSMILDSTTRGSLEELAEFKQGHGLTVLRQKLPLTELVDGLKSGELSNPMAIGTAAVLAPIIRYIIVQGGYDPETGMLEGGNVVDDFLINDGEVREESRELHRMYTEMQTGKRPAPEGWIQPIGSFDESPTGVEKIIQSHDPEHPKNV